jgi:glycosyltransferase involved in cell wall biosynthesis
MVGALHEVAKNGAPVLLVGLPQEDVAALSAGQTRLEVAAIRRTDGHALSDVLNQVAGIAGQADLVLVSAVCRVPPGWLERLRDAAISDSTIATATPLGNDCGTLDVAYRGSRDPDGLIQAAATGARPRLLIGGPHCLYVRRSAIELVGGFPSHHETLAAATAAFCELCQQAGTLNVLADDVFVSCEEPAQEGAEVPAPRLRQLDRLDERSALDRSLSLASSALGGLSVTIDARSLGTTVGGTQRYTRELALALARFGNLALRVMVGPDIAPAALAELADAPGVRVITTEQAVAGVERTHVVHRPQQVFSPDDVVLLELLGSRLVVTHQDLIAYHNPSYHATFDSWIQYRRTTRLALAAADRVLFLSEHALRDAEAEDLVEPAYCDVVGAAEFIETAHDARSPPGLQPQVEFILCLGPDYRHKNRPFAIELVQALRAEQGWRGVLVLAGGHVPYGSSRNLETELLAGDPNLRDAVIDVGSVDESERRWLLANARAIVVPSVIEGFGLVALEAARSAIPCLYAPQSSLVEVVSGALATLVPWNASASARRVRPLLSDGPGRAHHIERQGAAAERWSWDSLAQQLIQSYERAMRLPYRPSAPRAWQELERERYIIELDRGREHNRRIAEDLLQRLGDRIPLAADDGFLTAREQQGLLRVGARPAFRRLMLWPFALLGSVPSRARDIESHDPESHDPGA